MDFATMMKTRHSCRAYQDKPVAREDLVKIAEAGRLTPSGCNSQPWKFVMVDEPAARALMCDALVYDGDKTSCTWRAQVPAFVVLCERKAQVMPSVLEYFGDSQRFAQGDIGAAAMNMCHQAMELGLDSCVLGMFDEEKLRRHFAIPEDVTVRLVLAIGYGAEGDVAPRPRKALEEVCSFNHW